MKYIYFFILFLGITATIEGETKTTILLSNSSSIFLKGVLGFQSSFRGETEIKFLEDLKTQENIETFFSNYESKNYPFLVAFGYEATAISLKNLKSTPILFSFLSNSRDFFKQDRKICGIEMKPNPIEILKTLKEMKPDSENILSIYSTDSSSYLIQEYEYMDLTYKLFLNKYRVDDFENFKMIIDSEIDKNDAILLVSDPILDFRGFNYVSKLAKSKGKILITPINSMVELGASFSVSSDNIHLGEELGRFANKLIDKEIECKKGPLEFPQSQFLYINREYLEESGIKIPEKLLRKQESDKYSLMAIELYYRKMYRSSKNIFEFIRENFPENSVYKDYLDNLLTLLSNEKMQSSLKEADNAIKNNNYKKAFEIYKNLEKIYPNTQSISEKINNLLLRESDEKKLEAKKLIQNKKYFDAIRKLNESLKIYPKNSQAKHELEQIKNQEKKKYSENFQIAVDFYNNRNYELALQLFNDLYLIEPGDNKLLDYIRLSRLKFESLSRLQKCKTNPDESCGIVK